MADGLLGRWSRRKLDAKAGRPAGEEPLATGTSPVQTQPVLAQDLGAAASVRGRSSLPAELNSAQAIPSTVQAEPVEAPPSGSGATAPTLEQAQALTPESDFKPFVARSVTPEVRNAAMKKLFADPHFNVMDRMDVYIDDYNISEPIPEAMMRQMASAQFLKMFEEDEPKKATAPRDDADGSGTETVAHSEPDEAPAAVPDPDSRKPEHADPDLRLQPDHAAAAPADRRGAG